MSDIDMLNIAMIQIFGKLHELADKIDDIEKRLEKLEAKEDNQ